VKNNKQDYAEKDEGKSEDYSKKGKKEEIKEEDIAATAHEYNKEESDQLSEEESKKLLEQVEREHKYCLADMKPWLDEQLKRLKLHNNQKREKNKVGDPLLFTVLQTVVAALYSDTLQVEFKGRDEGDGNTASYLNDVAKFDYDEMGKDIIDYDQLWDTCFFGRSFVELTHFDRETMTPIPEVIDPTTFLHDPRAISVHGNRLGKGAMRFGGQEIAMTLWEMENNKAFYNLDKIKNASKNQNGMTSDYESLSQEARQARADAQGRQDSNPGAEAGLGDNTQYDLLKWYTHFNGHKCVVYLGNNRTCIVRYHEVETSYWPIFDRPLYPTAHSWHGTSIPDVTEDKQRMRSILQNAMSDAAISSVYPMYIYNTNKIKNRADLDFGFNKHIPIDGEIEGAVAPLAKAQINSVLVDYVLQSLDAAAQKATATPEIQQGSMSDQQRTLGELELIASKSGTRYSLTAKVFGWSEKRFWQHWYWMYKNYMVDDIDEKFVRISGAWGDQIRKLTKDQLIKEVDPDVYITSKQMGEAESLRKQQRLEKFTELALSAEGVNRRYLIKLVGREYSFKPDQLDRMFPPTADELIAVKENESLSKNKTVNVTDNDNHVVHLEMHALASETHAKEAHMFAHKEALRLMRTNPELFPKADPSVFQQAGMTPPGGNMVNQQLGGQPVPQAADMPGNPPQQAQQQAIPKQGLT
jgi:hypothetical protein